MKNPIKRLEIIKNAIELEDDDIIQSQLLHLKNEASDPELALIVSALEKKNYLEAMQAIATWLQGQRLVVNWQDPQVAASKLELKALEERLRDLIDRRNVRIQLLDDFNDLYRQRLGPLMTQILGLRKTLAEATLRKRKAEAERRQADYLRCQHYMAQAVEELVTLTQRWRSLDPHSPQAVEARRQVLQQNTLIATLLSEAQELEHGLTREEEPARRARDDANRQYEEHQEQQEDAEKRFGDRLNMSEDDHREMKRLWRQASKLCHPDLVDIPLKSEANAMMAQLNQAKKRGDLPAVRSILNRLQQGMDPLMASDRINDLDQLLKRIKDVKERIVSLQEELKALDTEESWLLVSSLTDQNAYFTQQEKTLADLRAQLEEQISAVEYDAVA